MSRDLRLGGASVAVCAAQPADTVSLARAREIAGRLALPLVTFGDTDHDLLLTVADGRVCLVFPQYRGPAPLVVDFVDGPFGYARRLNRFGMLFQAVGFAKGRPSILDATAGLGRDAFRLAYHGATVVAVERNAVLFELVQDGLSRALEIPEIRERLEGRLQLVSADAREYMRGISERQRPDVVYLDPMFPPKKKTALVKAEMRMLRGLVGDDPDASELFAAAREIARRRVVVKRHRLADPLFPSPSHSHSDKTTRYDVYLSKCPPLD